MSHRGQLLDVADAPGRLADDPKRRESDPSGYLHGSGPDPSPSFSKGWTHCWNRSEESVEVSGADSDESASESRGGEFAEFAKDAGEARADIV